MHRIDFLLIKKKKVGILENLDIPIQNGLPPVSYILPKYKFKSNI